MKPVWLVEAGVYGAEVEPLFAEVRRQGMVCEFVQYRQLIKGASPAVGGRPLARGDCVIFYGTFPVMRQIQLHHGWVPGGWCSSENLDCATYFAHFGKYLLNEQYAILPGVEAVRQRDWLFEVFGREGEVFARPTGCGKMFVGRCIARDDFERALAPTRYDPATLVVLARPRDIDREWRLVVCEGEVIAASQYAVGGARDIAPGCPPEVTAFAQEMLTDVRWRPDPLFMLDVCASAGRLRLVELNSFSCSWLYGCDLPTVVARASEVAARAAPPLPP